MNDHFDEAGFADSVLNSHEDFEPYGFVAPQVGPATAAYPAARKDGLRERVIEAELLSHCSMVGC